MEKKYLVLYLAIFTCFSHVNAQGARYIEQQLLCALDEAPCDAWGRQIKAALPEIIGKRCLNCNRSQLNNVSRVARFVETRYPNLWAAIVEKYSKPTQQSPPDTFYNVATET